VLRATFFRLLRSVRPGGPEHGGQQNPRINYELRDIESPCSPTPQTEFAQRGGAKIEIARHNRPAPESLIIDEARTGMRRRPVSYSASIICVHTTIVVCRRNRIACIIYRALMNHSSCTGEHTHTASQQKCRKTYSNLIKAFTDNQT